MIIAITIVLENLFGAHQIVILFCIPGNNKLGECRGRSIKGIDFGVDSDTLAARDLDKIATHLMHGVYPRFNLGKSRIVAGYFVK
jgi:hypothetical protein